MASISDRNAVKPATCTSCVTGYVCGAYLPCMEAAHPSTAIPSADELLILPNKCLYNRRFTAILSADEQCLSFTYTSPRC